MEEDIKLEQPPNEEAVEELTGGKEADRDGEQTQQGQHPES